MKKYLPYCMVIISVILMIIFPKVSVECAKSASRMCGEIIIPSLFPFFVCSGLLIRSGLAERTSVIARPIMRPLFNINENGAAAFVLGILSGYPLGAVTACELYENGSLSRSETERLLAFCNNSGPLFILGAVGSAMYSSVRAGLVLYIAHLAAAVSVGVIFRFYGLITSILPVSGILRAVICAAAELTSGTKNISELNIPLYVRLTMSAFTVGFAGLCVHLQVIAVCAGHGLSLKPYVFGKILHGVLSAVYTLTALYFFPVTEAVFREIPQKSAAVLAGSAYQAVTIIFALLLASGIMLLTSCTKINFFSKNS